MLLVEHFFQLFFFSFILVAPLPFCFSLLLINEEGENRYSFSHGALVLLASWCAFQISICLFLGMLHQFTASGVFIVELLQLMVGVTFLIYLKRHTLPFSLRELLRLKRFKKSELLVIGSVAFVGFIMLGRLVTRPVIEYDSLWYHLPNMAIWYQNGSFKMMEKTGDLVFDQTTRYPYNWEVLCTLFIIPFKEDFLATLPMLISWVVLGLSVYLLSLKIGANRLHAMAGSALAMTLPVLLLDLNSLHIDIPFAAFFAVSLYFAISYHQTRSLIDFMLFLASLGMLAGIKMSGIIYVLLLSAVLIIMEVKTVAFDREPVRPVFRPIKFSNYILGVGIFSLIFLGGFWYFKNLIEVGNFLGNVKLKIANIEVLKGNFDYNQIRATSLANLFDVRNISHWQIFSIQALARLQIPFLAMIFQMFLLPKALAAGKERIKDKYLLGLIALIIATGLLYWTTPFSGSAVLPPVPISPYIGLGLRYALPCLSLLAVAAAAIATRLQTPDKWVVATVVAGSLTGTVSSELFEIVKTQSFTGTKVIWASKLLDQLRTNPGETLGDFIKIVENANLFPILIYILLYAIVISILLRWDFAQPALERGRLNTELFSNLRQLRRASVIGGLIILLVTASFAAREKRNALRGDIYGGIYEYIARNAGQNEKIGYLLSYRSYLFYGKNLNQKVLHTPAKSNELSEWLEDLRQQGVTVVGVGPLKDNWQSSRELSWLENTDGPFIRVFGKDSKKEPVLYRFKGL